MQKNQKSTLCLMVSFTNAVGGGYIGIEHWCVREGRHSFPLGYLTTRNHFQMLSDQQAKLFLHDKVIFVSSKNHFSCEDVLQHYAPVWAEQKAEL